MNSGLNKIYYQNLKAINLFNILYFMSTAVIVLIRTLKLKNDLIK